MIFTKVGYFVVLFQETFWHLGKKILHFRAESEIKSWIPPSYLSVLNENNSSSLKQEETLGPNPSQGNKIAY